MKRIVFIIIVFVFCLSLQAQKITALTEATTIDINSLFMVRTGSTGDLLKKITLANIMKDLTLTGTITLPATTSIGLVSSTELGYVNGVTSAIQTQFTGKVSATDTATMLTKYARKTSPTFVNPALGTPASGVMTNVTGTAASLTAGAVTGYTPASGSLTLSGADVEFTTLERSVPLSGGAVLMNGSNVVIIQ